MVAAASASAIGLVTGPRPMPLPSPNRDVWHGHKETAQNVSWHEVSAWGRLFQRGVDFLVAEALFFVVLDAAGTGGSVACAVGVVLVVLRRLTAGAGAATSSTSLGASAETLCPLAVGRGATTAAAEEAEVTKPRVMLAVMSVAVFSASRVKVEAMCLPASITV